MFTHIYCFSTDRFEPLPPREFSAIVHSKDVCNSRHYSNSTYASEISLALPQLFNNKSVICVGNDAKPYGTCPGDSGEYSTLLCGLTIDSIVQNFFFPEALTRKSKTIAYMEHLL